MLLFVSTLARIVDVLGSTSDMGEMVRARFAVAVLVPATLVLPGCVGSDNPASTTKSTDPGTVLSSPSDDFSGMPVGEVIPDVPVLRVVDGDTFHVLLEGQDVTVRVLGIDTPETVKPGSPVECMGPEASDFAHAVLEDSVVTLEFDTSQDRMDKYGRLLAHAWIERPDGTLALYAGEAVSRGLADERIYGDEPHAWHDELAAVEVQAREQGRGMWGAC